MKKLLLILSAVVLVFSSCIKDLEDEDIYTETTIKGKVLEEGKNTPIANLSIRLTDGENIPKTTLTNERGEFELSITDEQISKGYYILVSADSIYSLKNIPLREINFGKKSFDLGVIYVKGAELPQVKTISITNVSVQVVECKGEVIHEGRSSVFQRGFCFATHPYPTNNDNIIELDTGVGQYSTLLQNLKLNTTYYVRAFAINSVGIAYGEQISITTLNGLPNVEMKTISNTTSNKTTVKADAVSDGGFFIIEKGFCYSTSTNPTIQNTHTSNGANIGEYSATLQNLSPNTLYYIRAYARNSAGVGYSEQMSFTTHSGLAVVTTKEVTNISSTSAQCGGDISSDGGFNIIERGVCYSTSPNPTINNAHTSDGVGIGSYVSYLTNLQPNTKYYIRSFAKNSIGISYGEAKIFITE